MARLTICDWEFGAILGSFMIENSNLANVAYQTATVRSGLYALQVNPVGGAIGWISWGKLGDPTITSSALTNRNYNSSGSPVPTSLFVRTYFQWLTKPAANDEEIMRVSVSTGAPALRVLLKSTGALEILDSTGASLGIGATILASGTWYRLELNANQGVASAFELRIDGVTELAGIANGTANNLALAILGKFTNRNGQTINVFYDDFVVDDAVWPGPGSVVNLRPDANGTFAQWTAGTGPSDFTQIDEIPVDNDTTYIASPAGGGAPEISTFNMQSCASQSIFGGIKAIQPWISWRRTVGIFASGRFRLISGATTNDSVLTNVVNAYRANYNIFNLDPNTGLPWTVAALNAVQHGPWTNDTAVSSRCTGIGIFVDFDDTILGSRPLLPLLGAGA